MINIINAFRDSLGAAGIIVATIVFLALTIVGVIISMRGRGAMIWLVSVSAFFFGLTLGSMIGILVFNSIIIMAVLGSIFAVLLVVVVRHFKSIGYFIGIGTLGWVLAYTVTSEMYISGGGVSENTLLFIDLVIAVVMGIMAACRSKYIVTFITSASGGIITAISALALLGFYFIDIKTWIIAVAVAVLGMLVQFKTYDMKLIRKRK